MRKFAGLVAGSAERRWRSGWRKLFLSGLPATRAGFGGGGQGRLIGFLRRAVVLLLTDYPGQRREVGDLAVRRGRNTLGGLSETIAPDHLEAEGLG